MEKSRTSGAPTSKSLKAAQLRQQFWDKQPELRTPDKYARDAGGVSENLRLYVPDAVGAVAVATVIDTTPAGISDEVTANREAETDILLRVSEPERASVQEVYIDEIEEPVLASEYKKTEVLLGRDSIMVSGGRVEGGRVETVAPEQFAQSLEKVRPEYGEIYTTALEMFPQTQTIRQMLGVKLNRYDSGSLSSGVKNEANGDVYPEIEVGEGSVLSKQKSRIAKRMGLGRLYTREQVHELPIKFWKMFVFAHELGHAMQHDKKFTDVFGSMDMNNYSHLASTDYKKYANSDRETNADYIAHLLLSNTGTGRSIGLPAPSYPPREWRKWRVEL